MTVDQMPLIGTIGTIGIIALLIVIAYGLEKIYNEIHARHSI